MQVHGRGGEGEVTRFTSSPPPSSRRGTTQRRGRGRHCDGRAHRFCKPRRRRSVDGDGGGGRVKATGVGDSRTGYRALESQTEPRRERTVCHDV